MCSIRDAEPSCVAEADAYLECIATTATASDFVCDNDKPTYVATNCDAQLGAWASCLPI